MTNPLPQPAPELSNRLVPARFQRGREVSAPYLEMWVDVNSNGAFVVVSQLPSALACTLGFAPPSLKLSGGQTVFFASPFPAEVRRHLEDFRCQQAMAELFRLGATEIELTSQQLVVRWKPFRADEVERVQRLEKAARAAKSLSANLVLALANADPAAARRFTARWRWVSSPQKMVVTLYFLVFFSTLGATLPGLFFPPLYWSSLWRLWAQVMIVPGLLSMLALRRFARRYPVRGMLGFYVFAGLLIPSLWTSGLLVATNGWQDHGRVERHTARIVLKWITHNKNSRGYWVRVRSWKNPGDTLDLKITSQEYDQIRSLSQYLLEATVKPGNWGVEWLAGTRVIHDDSEGDVEPMATPSGQGMIETAYQWGQRPRQVFAGKFSSAPADEKQFLMAMFELIDQGVATRVWREMQVSRTQAPFAPPTTYQALIQRLENLPAPARLQKVKEDVLAALRDQNDFFKLWETAEADGRQNEMTPWLHPDQPHAYLLSSSRRLRAAYACLMNLYPKEPAENQRAFMSYLAGLDFL